jgi:DNA replication and repair protein RecF
VTRLTLTDFRCHDLLRLTVSDGAIALVGANGCGKTSVLEAISLLAPGRGLRRARLAEIGRWQGSDRRGAPWAVAARLLGPRGAVDVGTGIELGSAGDRRIVRVDGAPLRGQAGLAEVVSILWLTPDMDRLFHETPAVRRRFFDRIVYGFDAAHAARVSAYERAMRERSRLLAQPAADSQWLAALERTMAIEGTSIAAARRAIATKLSAGNGAADRQTFPRATLSVVGSVEGWLASQDATLVVERFAAALAAARAADASAGATTVGPHRSDLSVWHAATGRAARDCSTGEQKAMLIAIVLAAARLLAEARGTPPILLLDEVTAHLDDRRRRELFDAVTALRGQAWYAATDRTTFAALSPAVELLDLEQLRRASREGASGCEGAVSNG